MPSSAWFLWPKGQRLADKGIRAFSAFMNWRCLKHSTNSRKALGRGGDGPSPSNLDFVWQKLGTGRPHPCMNWRCPQTASVFSVCRALDLRICRYMRWRVVALVSLGANIVLAVVLVLSARHMSQMLSSQSLTVAAYSPGQPGTNVVLRRQFFSWREIESDDYPTYVANL